ncbi:MAG: VWA domain-containing protein [Candidatus Riflebacteria bacterium]|nr:VWA domain-containing protein [Candidatus Riflebacteria bacterium]MBR4569161.1 VWA domain-containing protein [Candidatus Riflebacteria bacterium]
MANTTEMVFIIDKSGSMSGLESDTIGGFNSNISKQRETGENVLVTTVLFDTTFETLYDRVNISEVEKMTTKDYCPGGCTALCDAVGNTINRIKYAQQYLKKEERPDKTLFVIITDGFENSSREFSSSQIKKLITTQKKENDWEFLFLGANMDAVETANNYGIDADKAVTYMADAIGTSNAWNTLGAATACFLKEGCKAFSNGSWSKKIKEDTKSRKA